MPADRSKILTEAAKVKPSEVRWYFISNYYDGPISGLAYFREKVHRFCCFPEDIPEQHIYVLQEFTPTELVEELRSKTKFEELVGTHWSFSPDGTPFPRVLRDERLQKKFYDEEKTASFTESSERPVIAWFDVAEES